jgi:hypothetical protein
MADKQKLLELDLGTDAVIAKSVELKKSIADTREEIDRLKKSGDGNRETTVKLEASLKKLNTEYSQNQKVLSALVTTNGKAIPVQEKANLLLEQEIGIRQESKQAITEINRLRDSLNVNIKEEADLITRLNGKLDEHNNFLRGTGSEREKQIMNIGNYKDGVVAAIQETGAWSNELLTANQVISAFSLPFTELRKDLSESVNLMRNSAKSTEGMTVAQKGLTVATNVGTGAMRIFALALAATGIGLIVGLVVLLIGYLKTFTPVVDKVEQVFAGLGAVVKVVQQGLVSFITGLTDLGNTMKKIGAFFSDPIGSIKAFGNELADAADKAATLKKAQQDLEDAMESQEIATAKNRAEINRLNIQAKDRTKTEEERLALLRRAEKLEQADFEARKKNSDEALRIAQQQIINEAKLTEEEAKELKKRGFAYKEFVESRTNNTDELFDKLKEALLAETDIQNEYYSNQEKNINKQNKLIEDAEARKEKERQAEADRLKKAEEARRKALAQASALAKAELDLLLSSQGIKVKSLEQELKLAEKVRDQKLKIAQAEFNASEKTKADELKLLTDQNNIRDEFLKKQVDAVVNNASRELNAYIEANSAKIDSEKYFTELALAEQQRRLDLILQKELQYQALRFEQGVINEIEYQEEIKRIQDETQAKKDEARLVREEAEKEKQAIDLENQRAYEDIIFQENLEIQQQRLEQQRLQEIANSEKTGADIDKINKKYKAASEKLDREANAAKITNAQNSIGEIGQLTTAFFGENKQLSAALASVDMFLAIQKAYLSQLIPGDPTSIVRAQLAAFKAGAFGLANVIKVSGVKLASGGKVVGPGTGTSDSIPAMLSNGESVINAKSTGMFAPLLSWINQIGGGKAFASGGMATTLGVSNAVASMSGSSPLLDYDLLANKIAQANQSIPPPVLPMEDFHIANKSYIDLVNGANH